MIGVSASVVLGCVAEVFGKPVSALSCKGKARAAIVPARQAAVLLLRELPKLGGERRSFPDIATAMGYGDHSTVIYHARQGAARVLADPDFAGAVARCRALLAERAGGAALRPVPAEAVAAVATGTVVAGLGVARTVARRRNDFSRVEPEGRKAQRAVAVAVNGLGAAILNARAGGAMGKGPGQ